MSRPTGSRRIPKYRLHSPSGLAVPRFNVRDSIIESGLCRGEINKRVGRMVRMFKWGVESEFVAAMTHHAFSQVRGLSRGRSAASESDPVKPVADVAVDAITPHVSRCIWEMADLPRTPVEFGLERRQRHMSRSSAQIRQWVYVINSTSQSDGGSRPRKSNCYALRLVGTKRRKWSAQIRFAVPKCYEVTTPENRSQRLLLKLADMTNEPVVRWFEKCVTVTASLNHPHILPYLESGQINGCPYIVMPLVDGKNLVQFTRGRALPHAAEVIRIVRAVASALDYAHGRDVVHGNVHPKHVLLNRSGHVSIIGFAEAGSGSREEMIIGNPHHFAPEQLAHFESTVPKSDIYALAEIAFLLLSGTFPFQRTAGIVDLLNRKRFGPVPRIRDRRPELSFGVDLTLQRAMAIRPEERFPSAGQFVEELSVGLNC